MVSKRKEKRIEKREIRKEKGTKVGNLLRKVFKKKPEEKPEIPTKELVKENPKIKSSLDTEKPTPLKEKEISNAGKVIERFENLFTKQEGESTGQHIIRIIQGVPAKEGEIIKLTLPIGPTATSSLLKTGAAKATNFGSLETFLLGAGKVGTKTGAVAPNAKNAAQTIKIFGKNFKPKTLIAAGGSIAAATGTMFLGQWAQAESPEPISIVMRDVLREAEATGNWELYNEGKEARDDITNLSTWQKILQWTPASVLIGIPNKIKGAIEGGIIMDKLAADKQHQQETGESDDDKWARIREEQAEQERVNIDYYNSERKKMIKWEAEARTQNRKEEAAFWAAERKKQSQKEKEDAEAIAKFWLAYRKENQKLSESTRPSNLNFGLL